MINMGNLEGAVPVPRKRVREFPMYGFVPIGSTTTDPFFCLFIAWPTIDCRHKGFVAGGRNRPLCFTKGDEFAVHLPFVLLLVVLIFFVTYSPA
jgi:hypothetical protein